MLLMKIHEIYFLKVNVLKNKRKKHENIGDGLRKIHHDTSWKKGFPSFFAKSEWERMGLSTKKDKMRPQGTVN